MKSMLTSEKLPDDFGAPMRDGDLSWFVERYSNHQDEGHLLCPCNLLDEVLRLRKYMRDLLDGCTCHTTNGNVDCCVHDESVKR